MKYSALVPVKSLYEAKSRLAPHLSRIERRQLVIQMLHHVLHTLQACGQFERISVVSPDTTVLAMAQAWGMHAIIEEQPGHNPALHAAAQHERTRGIDALLTISADLPLLRPEEIACMLQAARCHDVVLAASREGTGTNAVLMRPPLIVPYVFGIDSLQRYQQEAHQRHLTSTVIHSTGLSYDIDTIEDVTDWKQQGCIPITLFS
jgi:2-phospho-L-lactate guanylyltransferase